MINVAVSGAGGRMGRMVAAAIAEAADLASRTSLRPSERMEHWSASDEISPDPDLVADSGVVVEFTHPDVVMAQPRHVARHGRPRRGRHVRLLRRAARSRCASLWVDAASNCLIVPNFAIGAVLMMRFAELAAPHFPAAEIIELHHDRKADAPSGTAIATASRIGAAQPNQERAVASHELEQVPPALGSSGVAVHSVRLPGIVANQEVIFGGPGQTLTIRHDTTDRTAFAPGVLLAARNVHRLPDRVTVGLDALLSL